MVYIFGGLMKARYRNLENLWLDPDGIVAYRACMSLKGLRKSKDFFTWMTETNVMLVIH